MCQQLKNHWYEKIKNKNENEKREKEKSLGIYNQQYKQRCNICGIYGHNPGDCKCLENKEENDRRKNRKIIERKKFDGICYHCGRKRHMSRDCKIKITTMERMRKQGKLLKRG